MSLSMEQQLLSYFGADIASKYSDFKIEHSKDVALDASQLNKLALRTTNPIRFLSACKENQALRFQIFGFNHQVDLVTLKYAASLRLFTWISWATPSNPLLWQRSIMIMVIGAIVTSRYNIDMY